MPIAMIAGKPVNFRVNPRRNKTTGEVIPTAKEKARRRHLSKMMKTAANVLRVRGFEPFTKPYYKEMKKLLKKEKSDHGLVKERAKVCRKGSKIMKCSNMM